MPTHITSSLPSLAQVRQERLTAFEGFIPPHGYPPINEIRVARADKPEEIELLFEHYKALVLQYMADVSDNKPAPTSQC